MLVQAMRGLRAEATLSLRGKTANARSAVALLSLGARRDDTLALQATGVEAALVLRTLERAISQAASMADGAAPGGNTGPAPAPAAGVVIAAPGIAVGPLVHIRPRIPEVSERGAGERAERQRLDEARARLAACGSGVD